MDDKTHDSQPTVSPALIQPRYEFMKLDKHGKYRIRHRLRIRARDARKRAGNAAPPWLTQEHLETIENIYEAAEQKEVWSSIRQEVDHIIPINHPDVCGLHVPWNLQILSDRLNIFKNNKFDGTQQNEGWRAELPANGVVFEHDFMPDDEDDIPF